MLTIQNKMEIRVGNSCGGYSKIHVLFLWILLWFLINGAHHVTKGDCLHDDHSYKNHSVWQPDPCTVCTCQDPVPMCEAIICTNPICNYTHSEKLELSLGQCCPICVKEKKPCDFRGQSVQHRTEWSTTSCQTCQCLDGHVICSDTWCPSIPCKPGEVSHMLPGQCCPRCLPSGRACFDEDGVRRLDGSEWFPLPCVKCVCRDGHTRCMPVDCPPIHCPGNTKPSIPSGQCCPVCGIAACQQGENIYKEGDAWSKDSCTTCTCRRGDIVCHRLDCLGPVECPLGKILKRMEGQCCPQCVSQKDTCRLPGSSDRLHGEMWRVEPCEYCMCHRGVVSCQHAQCPPLVCQQGEEKKKLPGQCCPQCVAAKVCTVKGQTYQSGQSWDPDACSSCECRESRVTCYRKECPACGNGQRGPPSKSGTCCQKCETPSAQAVQCQGDCLTCDPTNLEVCTSCKSNDKLVQNGVCVDSCRNGFYPNADHDCKGCHTTCKSCFDQSEYQCLSCVQNHHMKDGQCLPHCGDSYYLRDNVCTRCHSSCRVCRGPREDQCLVCHIPGQVLFMGRCVDNCGPTYFLEGQHCTRCPSACLTCHPDGIRCTSCPPTLYMFNGDCVVNCPKGHFIGDWDRCQACHPSCHECNGPSETDCVACVDGKTPGDGGTCIESYGPCPDGQYFSLGRKCFDCYQGCRTCYPDPVRKGSICTVCQDPNQTPFGSRCYSDCPLGSVMRNGVCFPCESRCRECDSMGMCLQCFTPFLLSKGGHCVLDCGYGKYADNGRCHDCGQNCLKCGNRTTCLSCKHSTWLKKGRCVNRCGRGFITRHERRVCEGNKSPPELSVTDPLVVTEGGLTDLTERLLHVIDVDTPLEFLSVVVERPPTFGHIIKTDLNGNTRLSKRNAFMLNDMRTRRIRYTQDVNPHGVSDSISLKAYDGQLYSSIIEVPIVIQPKDKMGIITNKPVITKYGSDVILNEEVIAVKTSQQNSENALFSILDGPIYGDFINRDLSNKSIKSFTLDSLKKGSISYSHHGNGSHKLDMTRILVDDGFSQIYLVLTIKVTVKTSLLPVVVANTGSRVYQGKTGQITNDMLQAHIQGKRSVATLDVVYTLSPTAGNPRHGHVLMVVQMPDTGPSRGWEGMSNGKMAAIMRRFTQRDIDGGRIFYRHAGTSGSVNDEIRFEVSDTAQPPNTLKGQVFHIQILPDDTSPLSMPTLAPGVKLGMTVYENQIVPITSTHMSFQDDDTPSTDLVYKITSLLEAEEGMVEHIDSPFKRVLQFTQDDINNNRIVYRPPEDELGHEPIDVSFLFIVTDGKNVQELKQHQFTIHVIPVNNNPPHFVNPVLNISVMEKGRVILTASMLEVIDMDTAQDQLEMRLDTPPTSGVVERKVRGAQAVLRKGDRFPYSDISSSDIVYLHTGSVDPPNDTIVFFVSDREHQSNMTIHLTIVKIDKSAPQMLPTASCQLNVSEGASVPITRNEIVFSDSDDADAAISIVLAKETTHGHFIVGGVRTHQGDGFSQEDINQGRVKFQVEKEIGYKPITELVYLNVSDSSGNILPNQIMSVSIQPVDNLAPVITFGSRTHVDEGGHVALSPDSLTVMDIDTRLADLTVLVKRLPAHGMILNRKPDRASERHTSGLKSFSVRDLLDGNLVYENTDYKGTEPTADAFLFYVTDGKNKSPLHRFNITIHPINDEKPSIVTEQLFVEEGQAVTLTNASMFVVDLDSLPGDLLFTVESMPVNGVLLRKGLPMNTLDKSVILEDKATFSYDDILRERIVYKHNDGETSQDSIHLSLTDGDFVDSKTIHILVGLVNDETPRVTINRGLRVKVGSKTHLTSRDLKATDLDSDNDEIQYTIVRDPNAGTLQFDNQAVKYILTSTTEARSFKQKDIDNGHIVYSHTVGAMTGSIFFQFKLSDPEGNDLIDQDFFITVLEDRLLPVEVTNKEFSVTEGEAVKLTTEHLSYTDHDSDPGSLTYTVLDGPQLGHLELTGQPGIAVVTFTQSDLAAKSVLYAHTTHEEHHLDKFIFSVTDGTNELMSSFYIRIKPVDDAIPHLINKGLRVQEGVRKLITEFNLKAVDQDTKEHSITFTVLDPPIHGSLDLITLDGRHSPVTSFSMADVYENRVSYQHDGSETQSDQFTFLVDDGTNKAFTMMQQDQPSSASDSISTPQDFQITVLAMDDGMPVPHINLGLQYLDTKDGEVGRAISSRELMTTDEDTGPDGIIYTITQPPVWGILESASQLGNSTQFSFTQDDLDKGRVFYRLMNKTDEYKDQFVFSVGDSRPHVVPDNEFHIMWSEISLARDTLNVSEKEGLIRVPIVRKGNLKQYSIVKCVTTPGMAMSRGGRGLASSEDYVHMEGQVQFDEWQDEKTCNILIKDDAIFEGEETFFVHISSPTYAILGDIVKASVIIRDKEDEPVVQFSSEVIQVNETDGVVRAVITRTGDLTNSMSVICSTHSLTATGSSLEGLESGSDYVSRGVTNDYRVTFPAEVSDAMCDVKLVDDSEFESMEQFEVKLSQPSLPATLGAVNTLVVVIEGPNDESFIYLSEAEYIYPENSGTVELGVTREGSDLSHTSIVWCATRMSPTPSARPGQDYIPSSTQITFGPGQTLQYCPLTLLDDEFEPRLEGNETFHVFLSSAIGSNLKQPIQASVVIYDDVLDLPRMNFAQEKYEIDEGNKTVNVSIVRQGDITLASSVVCYTRQRTAEVGVDYVERTFTNKSRVHFKSGDKVKQCLVDILDDTSYEQTEVFLLKLGHPEGTNNSGAVIGDMDKTAIKITDRDDVPRIMFEESSYSINEPSVIDQVGTVFLKVVRLGAVNGTAWARCSTRDGSAVSGLDYNAKSVVLQFEPGQNKLDFSIDVLFNSALEWHESLSVQLGPEVSVGTQIGSINVATVTILDNEVSGSLVLPAPPVVVSLLHHGNTETGMKIDPSPGYPLICITACDPEHPAFSTTNSICEDSKINRTAMVYSWEVAMPPEEDGDDDDDDDAIFHPFVTVTDQTLFTFTDRKVLDSIYFRSFFRVRCVTQPLQENGNPGVPIKSVPVTIGHTNPICKAPSTIPATNRYNSFQAQSFLARLEYVPPEHETHSNTLHISVEIPHQDGMLPLVSTHPLHNLRLLLSNSLYRQQHICSNIILNDELLPMMGKAFLDNDGKETDEMTSYGPGMDFPHQFDQRLRSKETLRLYRHLNLKSCKWQFDAWYHMTELIDLCGGHVLSDFQVKDKSSAHLTVRVPLHVSYVFVTAPRGWSSMEHHSDMEFSFYYSTMLWSSGLETEERQGGKLQVVRILIEEDGKLVIEFRTQTKFRGLFVMSHHSLPDVTSMVGAPKSLTISFDLELVWSQSTFDGPFQMWRAKSKYNLKDYTGVYKVDLIPCLVSPTQQFLNTDPITCAARQPERFEIPISFQQTNRPVPVMYSLNTEFQLGNSLDMFLSPPGKPQDRQELDWDFSGAFSKGQRLYGRVLWHPDQDLKAGYHLALDKVYLCTGRNGHIPTFDPDGNLYGNGPQYGCLQPSSNLLYRFLILDAENPEDQDSQFHEVPFNAVLAGHDPRYLGVGGMPGVDGFVMDVDPLYKVNSGHEWYLQVVYTVGVADKSKYRQRRSGSSLSPSSLHRPISYYTQQQSHNTKGEDEYYHDARAYKSSKKMKRSKRQISNYIYNNSSSYSNKSHNGWRRDILFRKTNRDKRDTNSSLSYSWERKYSSTTSGLQNGTNMQLVHLVFHTDTKPPTVALISAPYVYIPIVIIVCILLVFVICICIRKRVKHKNDQEAYPSPFINNLIAAKNNPHSVARVKVPNSKMSKMVVSGGGDKHSNMSSCVMKSNLCKIKEGNISREVKTDSSGTEV